MKKLLNKEFKLAMHPSIYIMLIMSIMVTIPNYPYEIVFFYLTLGIFMLCQLGRENHDVVYSLTLPVAKRDVVKARFLFTIILELIQIVLVLILSKTGSGLPNYAGMDANIVLIAEGFIIYGVFNLVFFTRYYKDVTKVGFSYFIAAVCVGLLIFASLMATAVVPYIALFLDTPDPMFMSAKLAVLAAGIVIFALLTFLSYKVSARRFERQDIR